MRDATSSLPRVSVVMAVHNEEEYAAGAIQSILDQTFEDFEFIIIDDASTDNTPEILRDFAAKDGRIRILTNDKNLSVPRSLNKGLEAATGAYIARMDGDDVCMPHRLQSQVAFLDENPEFFLVGGGVAFIDAQGRRYAEYPNGASQHEFEWTSFFRPPVVHSSAVFRRSIAAEHGENYDHDFNRAADFEYWHRVLQHGAGCVLPGILVQYRVHAKNVSTVHNVRQREVANRAAQIHARKHFPEIPEENRKRLFDFLRAEETPHPGELKQIIETIETMQQSFAGRRDLTASQIKDIRRKTAKLLIKTALDRGYFRRADGAAPALELIARYFPEYAQDAIALLRRRAGFSRAA